jgi:hypothetical protein
MYGTKHLYVGMTDKDWEPLQPTTSTYTASIHSKRAPERQAKNEKVIMPIAKAKLLHSFLSEDEKSFFFQLFCIQKKKKKNGKTTYFCFYF